MGPNLIEFVDKGAAGFDMILNKDTANKHSGKSDRLSQLHSLPIG